MFNEDLLEPKDGFQSPINTEEFFPNSNSPTLGGASRPFTPTDASELDAVNKTNKIFDKWLRNIFSKKSDKRTTSPVRYVMKNGQRAHPSIKEMNWQIAVDNNQILKVKPLPVDQLTNASEHAFEPFKHLQMLVINQDIKEWYHAFALKTMSVRIYADDRTPLNTELIAMNFKEFRAAIEFTRAHLTYLDRVIVNTRKLPFELFVDYDTLVKPVIKEVKLKNQANRLNSKYKGVPAYTDFR